LSVFFSPMFPTTYLSNLFPISSLPQPFRIVPSQNAEVPLSRSVPGKSFPSPWFFSPLLSILLLFFHRYPGFFFYPVSPPFCFSLAKRPLSTKLYSKLFTFPPGFSKTFIWSIRQSQLRVSFRFGLPTNLLFHRLSFPLWGLGGLLSRSRSPLPQFSQEGPRTPRDNRPVSALLCIVPHRTNLPIH